MEILKINSMVDAKMGILEEKSTFLEKITTKIYQNTLSAKNLFQDIIGRPLAEKANKIYDLISPIQKPVDTDPDEHRVCSGSPDVLLSNLFGGDVVFLYNVKSFEIGEMCAEPCQHSLKITLHNGREIESGIKGYEAHYLIKKFSDVMEIPEHTIQHFANYRDFDEFGRFFSVNRGDEYRVCSGSSIPKSSVTPDMVKSIEIGEGCAESYPCKHSLKITLKDGREVDSGINGYNAHHLIKGLTDFIEIPEQLVQHFADYKDNEQLRSMGWKPKSAEEILTNLFAFCPKGEDEKN